MSEQKNIKIVLDTNVWISFLIGNKLSFLIDAIAYSTVEIVLCEQLKNEIFKVIQYPRLKDKVSVEKLNRIFDQFKNDIREYTQECTFTVCRDPKDNFLLDLAVSAKADYIVTGDLDLLDIKTFRGTKIINPAVFEKILQNMEKN